MAKTKITVNYEKAWYAVAATRIALGFIFLWAFLDKTMGLGLSTPHDKAWVLGASPTSGFLLNGVSPDSPFASFFHGLAGNVFIDWLFMLGLLGIGLALILGIGLRVAALTGTVLMVMMWAAALPMKQNPVLDEHLIYAIMFWVFAFGKRKWSLFDTWHKTEYVKKHHWVW